MGRTHLRGLEGSTEVTVVAVTEPVEAAAAPLREQGLAVYPTAEEMFADSELDGVLIAVPTPQHIDTTRRALEAGLPVQDFSLGSCCTVGATHRDTPLGQGWVAGRRGLVDADPV